MFVKLAVVACTLALANAAWTGPLAGGEPAARYPAGVSPQACPNFPNCANPALAANPSAPAPHTAPVYAQAPQYHQGAYNQAPVAYNPAPVAYNPAPAQYNPAPVQYNPAPVQYNPSPVQYNAAPAQYNPIGHNSLEEALNRGEYIGDGDYKGEGLAESGAYGNQAQPQAYHAAAAAHYNPVQYNAAPVQAYNHGTYNAAPTAYGQPAQIPAGVDPKSCPNYPFCT